MILLKVINIEKIIRNIAEISRETTTVQLRYYIGNETKKNYSSAGTSFAEKFISAEYPAATNSI